MRALSTIGAWLNARLGRAEPADAASLWLNYPIPHMAWTARPDGSIDDCNSHFSAYTGLAPEALAAGGWELVLDPDDRDATLTAWHAAVGAGAPFRAEARLRRADGEHRWHLLLADSTRTASGAIERWFGSCTNIQDQKDAERVLTVLAEVTQVLSASLDPVAIARALTERVAPSFVGYCEVQLYEPELRLVPAARAGDRTCLDEALTQRVQRAQRSGATLLTRELSVVPFGIGDDVLGWLIICNVRDDVRALVPELASRLGAAVSNANAYAREHRVATMFQRAALNENVPDVPGLRFSALYHAAQAEASVGGDWYDAFRLPDGRVVLSVGDVAGSGLDAAVAMASVRQSIRTAVLINPNPQAVLEAVDRIVRAMGHGRFVTAFVGVFDPVCGEFVFANAGHPPPLVRRANGELIELASGDLPLGLRQAGAAEAITTHIEPGALLVAFTDGLTEFERDPQNAYPRLLASVAGLAADGENLAAQILDDVSRGRPTHDDVALLVVSFGPPLTAIDGPRGAMCWQFDAGDAARATATRREFIARLQDAGLSRQELHAAELVFGELVGNAYRHARGAVEIVLDVSGSAAVLHVLDSGHGFEFRPRLPIDPMAERGRGLFLVNAFADEFSMQRRPSGGSHARAVLLGRTRVRTRAAMTRTSL